MSALPQSMGHAPSLDDLVVELPPERPVTEGTLLARFAAEVRRTASRRQRARGEVVALGDDVELDVVGTFEGRVIPFSVREGWRTELASDTRLPGFFEGLSGARVGETVTLALVLPPDYRVARLRGATAHFEVELKRALEVERLDGSSQAVLERLKLGITLDEAMNHVARQLEVEAASEANRELMERVLDELVARSHGTVSQAAIDAEIRQQWAETELPLLVRRNLGDETLADAFEQWRTDAATRADAERRIKVAAVLRTLAEAAHLEPAPENHAAVLDSVAQSSGTPAAELERLAANTPSLAERLHHLALRLTVLDFVLRRVKLALPAEIPTF